MDYNEQESGITLGEIFRVIFIKKWLLLAITLVIALVGTLVINFVISANQVEYKADFSISFAGVENNIYPDGTPFDYRDLISISSLTAAKDSDDKFKSIDISSMASSNEITLTQNVRTENSVAGSTYTLTVKGSYFDDASLARDFITTLTSYPASYAIESTENFNYTANLAAASSAALAYTDQLYYLNEQKTMLEEGYEELIEDNGGHFAVAITIGDTEKLQTLNDYAKEIDAYFRTTNLAALRAESQENSYISDPSFLNTVRLQKTALTSEKADNDAIITSLNAEIKKLVTIYGTNTASVITYESFNSRIAALAERNGEIARELKILENYLQQEGSSPSAAAVAFAEKLSEIKTALTDFTTIYAAVNRSVYAATSRVIYNNASIIVSEGDISIVVAIIGSLLGGFVVACIVNLIIDMPKYLREKRAALKKRNEREVEAEK